jgi:hypothetical protein
MAENVEAQPAANQEPNVQMDCKLALNRYLYIQNIYPQKLNTKSDLKIFTFKSDFGIYLKKLIDTEPLAPLELIKKVLLSGICIKIAITNFAFDLLNIGNSIKITRID